MGEGMRVQATWNGVVVADSDATIMVEGNHYFPRDAVNWQYLTASDTHTTCPWKGVASYHHIAVDGAVNRDAAWCYPQPSAAAREIADRVAFWRGVRVVAVTGVADTEARQ